jgi:hypothetical protein
MTNDPHNGVTLPCPHCNNPIALTAADGGKQVQCGSCDEPLLVAPDLSRLGAVLQEDFTLNVEPEPPAAAPRAEAPRVVIAIDFGSSRSGYAFAFPNQGEIKYNTDWPDQPFKYCKTLTTLLCLQNGQVAAWGYSAHTELARLRSEGQVRGYCLVSGFKPNLHTGAPSDRGPLLSGPAGRSWPVVDLIAAYLGHLKDFTLAKLQGGQTSFLRPEDICWCLTVPAIWSDADKQWMRVAAQKAGLIGRSAADAGRLCLALEPEAAALHCLELEKTTDPNHSELRPGTRFMVVDAGGGTVDITVHEVAAGGWLEEVVAGGGGLHGSLYVDHGFTTFLHEKLGGEVVDRFHNEKPHAMMRLMADWEQAKCGYHPGKRLTFVPLPGELHRLLARDYPAVLGQLAASQDGDEDNFRLDRRAMSAIFRKALDGVAAEVARHFQKLGELTCDYLFLVGGFAHSPLLQERLREEFGGRVRKIIIPPDPGAAVLSGAVAYALDPGKIRARRSRLTYGCRSLAPFSAGVDDEGRKVWHEDTQTWCCRNRFQVFVRVGEAVDVQRQVSHRFTVPGRTQKDTTVVFYASTRKHPRYTDEDGAAEIGKLQVRLPDAHQGPNRKMEITMYFGRAEITVQAKDLASGQVASTRLDFASTYFPQQHESSQ